MKLKKYEGLSSYLIDEDGSVFTLEGLEVSQIRVKPKEYVYLLSTDEMFNGVYLIRRFTSEDIVKAYNSPKAVKCDITQVKGTEPSGTVISGIEEAGEVKKDVYDILLEQQKIREGSIKINSKPRTLKDQKKLVNNGKKKPMKSLHNQPVKSKYLKKGEAVEGKAMNVGLKMLELKAIASEKGYVDPEQLDNPVLELVLVYLKNGEGIQVMLNNLKEVLTAEFGDRLCYYIVNGVVYESARKASSDLKISVNTVLKRCKSNKDGYFYIEK